MNLPRRLLGFVERQPFCFLVVMAASGLLAGNLLAAIGVTL